MNKRLHVVADSSGSMREMGKACLLVNLMRTLNQPLSVQPDLLHQVERRFWLWGNTLQALELQQHTSSSVPVSGSANLAALQTFVEQEIAQYGSCWLLVLSDGHFAGKELTTFVAWQAKQNSLYLQTVSVGADANTDKLAKLSAGRRYRADQILAAIRCLLLGSRTGVIAPRCAADLSPASAQEDWD